MKLHWLQSLLSVCSWRFCVRVLPARTFSTQRNEAPCESPVETITPLSILSLSVVDILVRSGVGTSTYVFTSKWGNLFTFTVLLSQNDACMVLVNVTAACSLFQNCPAVLYSASAPRWVTDRSCSMCPNSQTVCHALTQHLQLLRIRALM